ncbi:aminodeoxychorismate/anthranilate synthase component II [Alphaproteobacteria bacterium]|nr:aminodeoxychorismate/anthranilate synthase component II [Alphaproteobacteria bacterium]
MIIVIDHQDSFVETLARYIREAGHETLVLSQNTALDEVLAYRAEALVLSPGPGGPDTTGVTRDLLAQCPIDLPILGVCLGHQTLAAHFGGSVCRAKEPRHGKASPIIHTGHPMFAELPETFEAGRYHALIVEQLPEPLQVTATSALGEIMAFAHATRPVYGMQFHPESILTPQGRQLMANFLRLANLKADGKAA